MKQAVLVTALFAPILPSVSAAHGSCGHGYRSSVIRIVNANGIESKTDADGHFELTAPSGKVVVVRGYDNEPYVKFEGGKVSATATPKASPTWVVHHQGLTHSWDDHRMHRDAENPPPVVARAREQAHHISSWVVDGTVDGKPFAILGSLEWAPTKSGVGYEWISYVAIGGFLCYRGFILVNRVFVKR